MKLKQSNTYLARNDKNLLNLLQLIFCGTIISLSFDGVLKVKRLFDTILLGKSLQPPVFMISPLIILMQQKNEVIPFLLFKQ